MLKLKPAAVAREIVDAAQPVLDDFKNRIIADEEPMTDRLFGVISAALDGRRIGNLVWKARTLRTGRGKAAEEKRHGADILGVLEIDLAEYKTRKGFLLQAKHIEPGAWPSSREWKRFQDQCRTMLKRTHDAFAVIYSRAEGVHFIPAATILEIERDQVFQVGSRSLFGFFKAHVKCEVGDRRLAYPTIEVLDGLAGTPAEAVLDVPDARVLAMKVTDDTRSA